jgi:hypothetical protein
MRGTSEHVALDDRHLRAEPGGVCGRHVAGGSSTDDHEPYGHGSAG